MEEKVKRFLEKGELYSALKYCLFEFENSSGIHRQRIKTVLNLLVANDEVLVSADTMIKEQYEKAFESSLEEPVLDSFVGKAAFPVYNESGCSMVMMEVKDGHPEGVIDFAASEESQGSLFNCLKILWQLLQKNITASDLPKNDVTVTNWGLRYSIYTNPETTGRLATPTNLIIEGGSFQFAMFVATVSKVANTPVDPGYIFTGAFESSEQLVGVTGLPDKVRFIKKERPTFKKIVIPDRRFFSNNDKRFIIQNKEIFLEVSTPDELVEKVFGLQLNKILVFEKSRRHRLGVCRIISENLGLREIELYDKIDNKIFNRKKYKFNVVYCGMERANNEIKFNVFPLPEIAFYLKETPGTDVLFVFDYPSANTYMGNFISNNTQTTLAYSIGLKKDGPEAQIFAHRQGNSDKYLGKYYLRSDLLVKSE